ncbi:MAG: carbohydrate ABC transporter permease [Saccharofermentanales bacterium]
MTNSREGSMNKNADKLKTMKQKSIAVFWSILRGAILFGLCFMILYPVLLLFTKGFMGLQDMNDSSVVLFPKTVSLETLSLAADILDYFRSLAVTIAVVAGITIFQVISCLMAGYGFARFDIPFKNLLFAIVIFTIVVPPQLYMASTYLHFKAFDLFGIMNLLTGHPINMINTLTPLFLLGVTANGLKNGLFIYIFRQNFRNMPREIEEAAYVDGAGNWKIFAGVMIPNAIATIVTVALFSFVWVYNDSTISGILTGNSYLLSIQYLNISDISNLVLKDLGVTDALTYNPVYITALKSAGVLLVVMPLVLLYLSMQKFFVESVERSGLVG